MRKLILSTLILACVTTFGQFEGTIDFLKTKGNSDVRYTYSVKGEQVRIEQFGSDDELDSFEMVNTTTGMIYACSPHRRMYMEAKNKRPQRTADVLLSKSKTTKTIAGIKCTKWTVTCKAQDRKIIYWVADGDYNFFNPLLVALNRAEKTAIYWLQLEGTEGLFPMLAEEYNNDGLLISKLEVNSVVKGTQKDSKFKVPSDYKKLDK